MDIFHFFLYSPIPLILLLNNLHFVLLIMIFLLQ